MTLDEWIEEIVQMYESHGGVLSEEKKSKLLDEIDIPGMQENAESIMVEAGVIEIDEYIPESSRDVCEEVSSILLKEFFSRVSKGQSFGDEKRIKERFGKSL